MWILGRCIGFQYSKGLVFVIKGSVFLCIFWMCVCVVRVYIASRGVHYVWGRNFMVAKEVFFGFLGDFEVREPLLMVAEEVFFGFLGDLEVREPLLVVAE